MNRRAATLTATAALAGVALFGGCSAEPAPAAAVTSTPNAVPVDEPTPAQTLQQFYEAIRDSNHIKACSLIDAQTLRTFEFYRGSCATHLAEQYRDNHDRYKEVTVDSAYIKVDGDTATASSKAVSAPNQKYVYCEYDTFVKYGSTWRITDFN